MSSLGSFLQMLKCNRNFVSNRQKFSSHLVEVYHRSCRCIAMSNNTSSRVPRVVVWWRCWCLVRYGLLPCHSVNKWREKSSFFDILGETLLGYNYWKTSTPDSFVFLISFLPHFYHATCFLISFLSVLEPSFRPLLKLKKYGALITPQFLNPSAILNEFNSMFKVSYFVFFHVTSS